MKLHRHHLLILVFLFCSGRLGAQIFPISNNFFIQAGSSPVVSDLCNSINPKLNIVLQNKDFLRPQIDCRLWIRIEGSNGEVLETKQGYSAPIPITLFSGQIQTLSGDELAPYLAAQNMNISGMDVQQFLRDGTLPEGNYTFRIRVFRWNGPEQLSAEAVAMGFFNLSDPPLLTTPMDGSAVQALTPQSVLFSWSPRHSPMPDNSLVEYKMELWEILQNRNPQEAALFQQPIQTITTFNLNQLYAIEHTVLDTGKTYAWRVRAQTANGKGYFRNNGYSEVQTFRYLSAKSMPYTDAPTNFELMRINLSNAEFRWNTDPRYQGYRLEYRLKNGNRWIPTMTNTGEGIANQLEPDREYQARVQGYNAAEDIYGFYSNTINFRTPKIPVFKCGETPDNKPLPTRPPLAKARKGDVFKMGGFHLYCTKVDGGGGIFRGEGIVNVPFLIQILTASAALNTIDTSIKALRTGFAVVFNNIAVDDDYNIVSGRVDVVSKGWKSMMTEVMDNEYKAPMSNKPSTSTVPDAKVDFVIGSKEDIKLDKEKGEITIKNPEPNAPPATIKLDKDKPTTVIEDKAGNVYSVDNKTGDVTIVGAKAPSEGPNAAPSIAEASSINTNQATVEWKNPDNAIGGLDTKTTKEIAAAFKSKYEISKMSTPSGDIYAPFKAVRANGMDYITAKVTIIDKIVLTDSVRFVTLSGIVLKPTGVNGTTYTLTLTGKDHATMEVIVAQAKTKAGKWQVISKLIQRNYKEDPKTLHLIPMGEGVNISESAINEALQKYFGKQGGKWNVLIKPKVNLPEGWKNKKNIDIDAGALSCYTAEMKEVINTFKKQQGYNEKDYYIFVSSISSNNSSVKGEMPRGEQFGFIFDANPSGDLVAHELGHGAYYFEHFWDEVKNVPRGQSGGNLMDYPMGNDLRVFQWDDIHERPADFISPCWKSDEAGQLAGSIWFTPDWKPFSFDLSATASSCKDVKVDNGTIAGVFYNNKSYCAKFNNNKFIGYYADGISTPLDIDYKNLNDNDLINLYQNNGGCGKDKYYRTSYSYITKYKKHTSGSFNFNSISQDLKDEKIVDKDIISCVSPDGKGTGTYAEAKPNVFDYSGLSSTERQKLINELNSAKETSGKNCKLFITDNNTPKNIQDSIQNYISKSNNDEIVLWVDYKNGKDKTPTLTFSNNVKNNSLVAKFIALLPDLPKMNFNPFTAILDGLAGLIGKANISEKYYNPDFKDYNSLPSELYRLANPTTFALDARYAIVADNTNYTASRVQFAFICGISNGAVDIVKGLPEGGSFLIKYITNEEDTRTKLHSALDKMSWSKVGDMIGDKVKECKTNPCVISYCSGYTTLSVVTIVLPFTQIGKAGTVAQGLNALQKLDMLGVALEKTLSVAGKAIKFTIKASNFTFKVSKAFIKPGFKLASGGKMYAVLIPLVDISPNLKAAYEKAIELINKGKTSANNLEVEHIIDGKSIKGKLTEVLENGQNVIDENGNKLALLEVDGEKIPVLIAEDGTTSKLAQSADEVVDDASKALVKVQGAGDISSTLSKITSLTAAEKATLKTLLEADADLAKAFAKAPEEMAGAWKSLKGPHPNLAKQADALEAFVKLKKNPSFNKMGLTDEVIASIQYYGTTTRSASYAEILNDLNKFGDFLHANPSTTIENFDKIINILKRTDGAGNNYKQGVHWMIRDLNTNGSIFAGKKIRFEHSIPNARPTNANSSIDLFCVNCNPPNLKVEYKSGPGSITSSTIKEQFIERDLFNANSLNDIQWRMEGTGMTKEKLIEYLSTTESREALKKISAEKANKLLKRLDLDDDFPEEIAEAFINNFKNDSNFNLIFK